MFCKSQGVTLKTTYIDDGLVVWREFENCITLIVSAKGIPLRVINDLMELVFSSMVFSVSLNGLRHNKNVEQLKRELKPYYPIIDKLLDSSLDMDLLKFSDCIMSNESNQLNEKLSEFSSRIGSPFCCLLAYHKILVGTEGWWDLNVIDRKLLITLLSSGATNISNPPDYPVFLPCKSPNIAYRFVCVPIWQNISVCVLCGAEPRYPEIEQLVQQIWTDRSDYAILEAAEISYPRNFPSNLQFSQGILGYFLSLHIFYIYLTNLSAFSIILINKTHSKYIISRNIQQTNSGKRSMSSGGHRLDILRTFFHQAIDTVDDALNSDVSNSILVADKMTFDLVDGSGLNPGPANLVAKKTIKSSEAYWCSDYHKCHSYTYGDNIICILYIAAIPTHTMRYI